MKCALSACLGILSGNLLQFVAEASVTAVEPTRQAVEGRGVWIHAGMFEER